MRQGPRITIHCTAIGLVAALWAGCGGANAVDFGRGAIDAGGGSDSGSGSGGGSGSSSGGTVTTSSSGSGSSGGGASGSSGGATSSSGSGGTASSSTSGGGVSSSGSGSSSGGGSGSGSGGTTFGCPQSPCPAGTVCCTQAGGTSIACSPACTSDDTLACLGPNDCPYNQDCCETLVLVGGQAPNCMAQSIASQCQSDCKSKITFSCQASETFHLCAQSADCANDSASPNCCMLRGQLVCVSDTLAQTLNNCQM